MTTDHNEHAHHQEPEDADNQPIEGMTPEEQRREMRRRFDAVNAREHGHHKRRQDADVSSGRGKVVDTP